MAATEDARIVVDCPECRRVMWANGTCSHGQVPPPMEPVPPPPEDNEPYKRSKYR